MNRWIGAALALALTTGQGVAQVRGPTLTGYVRLLGGGQDLGYDLTGLDRRSTFSGGVARLQWGLDLGPSVHVEMHDRLQGIVRSTTQGNRVLGFGVSAVPKRFVDLSTTLAEGDHGSLEHDIDRLALTVRSGLGDLTVGRQAITWGIASVFPVADLWAQFSPFELDTEQKPGADAVRFLAYPTGAVELDLVAADRGPARDFSAGARATITLPAADVYVAAGKFWREFIAMGGVAAVSGTWKFRAEAAAPYNLDAEVMGDARVTLGVDRIGARWMVSVEYHDNGLGSNDPADYASLVSRPAFSRGETYFLGRHLVGAFGSWQADSRWTVTLGSLVNPGDPSVALLPSVVWDAGQRYRFIGGGLWSFGGTPTFQAPLGLRLESEFGTYGRFGYVQAAVYF